MAVSTGVEYESLRTFDWTANQQPSLTVIETVADLDDTDPLDLVPLATVIDPDALNRLVEQSTRSAASDPTISFVYCGYKLQLTPEGGTVYGIPQQG